MAEYGVRASIFSRARQPEKLFSLLLLFILLTSAAASVTSVLIGPDWGALWKGLFFGLLFGWFLALLRQKAGWSALITIVVGITYTLVFTGGLHTRVSAILVESGSILRHLVISTEFFQKDAAVLGQSLQDLMRDTGVILDRVSVWLGALITGEAIFDPLAAVLVWSIMVWVVAAWSGWVIEAHRNALLAVLPAILLSLATLSYGRHESSALYIMLGITLLLLAIVHFERREQDWDKSEIAYPPRKGRQVVNAAAVLSIGLVILSAVLSSFSLPRILEWVSAQREPAPAEEGGLATSLGIISGSTPTADIFQEVRRPGLPREKLIGSGPELTQQTVMTVEVEDYPEIFSGRQYYPLYWRSYTYDKYTGHGWQTSDTLSSAYSAEQRFRVEQGKDQILIQETVRFIEENVSILYAAGEPASVNRSSNVALRSSEDLFGIQIESTAGYQVQSLFPVVSESRLRAAGQNYPDWVKRRYLSVPEEMPGRVKELAIQLTASEPTPYDRARAIEQYLRTIPYTLDVPYPPLDQDLVDFFLFDLRQGFCDYYASAMVILARSSGIPARLAVGYANGTYDFKTNRFRVSEADAHSWVEIYFPGTGWIPFEPTAGRPPIQNSQSMGEPEEREGITGGVNPDQDNQEPVVSFNTIVIIGLAWILAAGAVWIASSEIRMRHLPEQAAAGIVYHRMKRYGSRLGVNQLSGDTLLEFAAALKDRIMELDNPRNFSKYLVQSSEQITRIIERIVEVSYHPYPLAVIRNRTIYCQWQTLRWQLQAIWFIQKYQVLHRRLMNTFAIFTLRNAWKERPGGGD